MKKTELKDVYTVPKTEEEWKKLDSVHGFNVVGEENGFVKSNDIVVYEPEGLYQACLRLENSDIKEIPLSKFSDLLEDRIVGWRLEEIGFRDFPTISDKGRWVLRLENGMNIIIFEDMIPFLEVSYNELKELNIKTLTELETLIRFLR